VTPSADDPVRNQLRIWKTLGFGFLEKYEVQAQAATAEAPGPAPAAPPAAALGAAPSLALEDRVTALQAIATEVAGCEKCRLCHGRTNTVPGEGDPMAELMFIGEGPGFNEDQQGRPFVGKAGDLLTKIIEAMQFKRSEVFIGNVVKCRPPQNRQPEPDEMETCLPYLHRQIDVLQPKAIVLLGRTALMGLMPDLRDKSMTAARGQWLDLHGIPVMPTYHPAYLLRNASAKRLVWEDMKQVMSFFGRTPPGKGG
jgi:DNA polymerase